MLALRPQRTIVICWMTALGSTPSRSCMKVPSESLNGPNVSGAAQPITFSNHPIASSMSGTVMPTWSMPTMPSWPAGVLCAAAAEGGGAAAPSPARTTPIAAARASATATATENARSIDAIVPVRARKVKRRANDSAAARRLLARCGSGRGLLYGDPNGRLDGLRAPTSATESPGAPARGARDARHRLRQPEGRRGQDDDDAQPRRRVLGAGARRPARRPRPAGQLDHEPGLEPGRHRALDVRRARPPRADRRGHPPG